MILLAISPCKKDGKQVNNCQGKLLSLYLSHMRRIAVSPNGSVLTDQGPFYGPFCYFGSVLGLYYLEGLFFIENIVLNV